MHGEVPYPPASLMGRIGDMDQVERFIDRGKSDLASMMGPLGITPHSNIVDIGCGVARIAYPLRDVLDSGRYIGIDCARDFIEWLEAAFRPDPRFSFQWVNVLNQMYAGRNDGTFAGFNVPDQWADCCMLLSVFTHTQTAVTIAYLLEIARFLKPDGRLFTSWFKTTSPARTSRDQTRIVHFEEDIHAMLWACGFDIISAQDGEHEDTEYHDQYKVMCRPGGFGAVGAQR